ncbi:BA14K family protein [Mesorhizobium mediterraneum]|uniref:BA14K family protein n=1 Tax=Mesorhizobium TaxID=68287 RepID=UPI00142D7048|nr:MULTISPECIES: BA14K family protein [Mesorhizobium]WIW56537.1 BA14K family protein [Mesorhizobium mediterraneum]
MPGSRAGCLANLNFSPHKPSRSHYRSYRLSEDNYTSYNGEQRPCISLYLDAGAAERTAQPPDDGASYVEASDTLPMDGYVPSQEAGAAWPWLPPDHVQYCFSRYRSYRPEDNSYQPIPAARAGSASVS